MNKAKISAGIVAITTIVLMFATTIGSAINNAEAQVDQRTRGNIEGVNQRSGQVIGSGLVNAQVGNVNVGVNVPANINACVLAQC